MLNLNDIVALAKQGYKPADIKELIELSRSAEPSEGTSQVTTDNEKSNEVANNEVDNDSNVQPTEGPEESKDDQIIDYKKKVEDLEKRIADLQKANTKKNIADTDDKSDSEVVFDLARNFM